MKDGDEIISSSIINLGAGTRGVQVAIEETLGKAGLNKSDLVYTVSTGYGRNSYEDADKAMSELSCHAKGGKYIFKDVITIIDIGGQDVKVLKLDPNGQLQNFVMNDKCAAGTGRFLEVMTKVLDVKLDDLGSLDAEATEATPISSTCTVFAESEVISSLAHNIDVKNIVRGIHQSVASRVCGLASRVGVQDPVAMTGGVSRNSGIVRAIERELDKEVITSEKSQLAGAIGAALFAYDNYKRHSAN